MNVQNNPLVLKAKNTMTTTSSVQTANRKWKAFGTPIMHLWTQGKSPQMTSEREKRGGIKKRQQRGKQNEHRKATHKKTCMEQRERYDRSHNHVIPKKTSWIPSWIWKEDTDKGTWTRKEEDDRQASMFTRHHHTTPLKRAAHRGFAFGNAAVAAPSPDCPSIR